MLDAVPPLSSPRRPAGERVTLPVAVDQPRRQAELGEPAPPRPAPRTSAAVRRCSRRRSRPRRRSPCATPRARAARARVDDVVHRVAAWRQRRTVVLEVARPPACDRDGLPGRAGVAAVVVGDADPPAAGGARPPAVAMSPPRLDQRAAADRVRGAPRPRGRRPTLSRSRRGRAGRRAGTRTDALARGRARSLASRARAHAAAA